jgi:hypothetical protein
MQYDELFEMSNFNWKTTGLPTYIEVWARTDPKYHGHDRYSLKVTKNNEWAGIFNVGQSPKFIKDLNKSLTTSDRNNIIAWIEEYYPLIISLIDGKIDSAEFAIELQKIRGSK